MKFRALIIASFFLSSPALVAGKADPQDQLDSAEAAYDAGDPEKALTHYKRVEEQYSSPDLFYNMGNAALRAEKLGEAIYYYRMARKRAPWDPDIEHNLEMAQERTQDEFENEPSQGIFHAFRDLIMAEPLGNWWSLALIASFFVAAAFVLLTYTPQGSRGTAWALLTSFLFLTLLFYGAERWKTRILEEETGAVVQSPSVRVRSEPRAEASITFVLHEGTTVELRDKKEAWREIRTPDAQVGWVPEEKLAPF